MNGLDRSRNLLATTLLLVSTVVAHAQVALPEAREIERYAAIWQKSPFVAATEVSPAAESIAKQFALTGFANIGGNDVIFVFDRKGLGRFTVAKGTPINGVELISVSEGLEVKDLKAVVRAQGETAEIIYDPSLSAEKGGQTTPQSPTAPPPSPPPPAPPVHQENTAALSGTTAASSEVPPRPVRTFKRKPISP